jgi:hypothetical protein
MMGIFGAILPRFVLLVGWFNDPGYWNTVIQSQLFFLLGFLVLPWTTLIYGLVAPNGLTVINIIFLIFALLIDLATWGVGALAARKQTSYYRGT